MPPAAGHLRGSSLKQRGHRLLRPHRPPPNRGCPRRAPLGRLAAPPLAGALAALLGAGEAAARLRPCPDGDGGWTLCRRHRGRDGPDRRRRRKKGKGSGSAPLPCGRGGPCLIFATSQGYAGNLGGLAGVDDKCNQLAAAGLPGRYLASLSDGTDSPATRFTRSPGPYRLVPNASDAGGPPPAVADDWADLTSCDGTGECLKHAIDRTKSGAVIPPDPPGPGPVPPSGPLALVWSNTGTDGQSLGGSEDCQSWSAPDVNQVTGRIGSTQRTDGIWTDLTNARLACFVELRLCCSQQS